MHRMNSGINIKIFFGCKLDSKLKLLLNESIAWKNAKIEGQANQSAWVETRHDGSDYLGIFLPSNPLKFSELKTVQTSFLSNLQLYSSEIDTKSIKLVLFPKVFIK